MSSHFQGFLSGCFKQGFADSMTAVIVGNMEAVNDEPAFVQLGNQHYFANHAISLISAICHVPPAENLFSFFDKTRSVPILSEGIVNQRQIPILQAVHVFYFLIPLKAFQRIPGEVMTVNKLYFQNIMPFILLFADHIFSFSAVHPSELMDADMVKIALKRIVHPVFILRIHKGDLGRSVPDLFYGVKNRQGILR